MTVESFVKTIRYRGNVTEEREYFGDSLKEDKSNLREGWYILKAKSFIDKRKDNKEMCPAVNIDGVKFIPGTVFQAHPVHAKIVIDLGQVEIIEEPRKANAKTTKEG